MSDLPVVRLILFATALVALILALIIARTARRESDAKTKESEARLPTVLLWVFVGVVVVALAIWAIFAAHDLLFSYLVNDMRFPRDHAATAAMSTIAGVLVWLVIAGAGIATALGDYAEAFVGNKAARKSDFIAKNLVLIVVGSLLGWAVAMAFTPFGEQERASLQSVWQSASLLVSGFLLSKIDRLLEGSLFVSDKPTRAWISFALVLSSLLVVLVAVLSNRIYGSEFANPDLVVKIEQRDQIITANGHVIEVQDGEVKIDEAVYGKISPPGTLRVSFTKPGAIFTTSENPTSTILKNSDSAAKKQPAVAEKNEPPTKAASTKPATPPGTSKPSGPAKASGKPPEQGAPASAVK